MEQEQPQETPVAETSPSPAPNSSVTLTAADLQLILKTAITEALAPMNKTVEELQQANARLQEQVTQVNATGYADGVPEEFRQGAADPLVDTTRGGFARSVTLATRPVQENPEQYKHVVDPGGISRISLQSLGWKPPKETWLGTDKS